MRRLYELKGRNHDQPTALIATSIDALLLLLPELGEESVAIARTSCRARTRSCSRTQNVVTAT